MIIKYGKKIENWRDNRDVTRKEIYLEFTELEEAITDYLKNKNMLPEDIEDQSKFDTNLEYSSFGRGNWYETPSIAGATYSFMIDSKDIIEDITKKEKIID